MKKINVAIIGVGNLGEHHARIYSTLENVNVVGIVDNDQKRSEEIAAKYQLKSFRKYEDIPEKIDAASLVVPTKLHYQIAQELLEKDIHLLVEKPITETLEQAEALIKIAQERNLKLQVGHVERFNPAFLAIQQALTAPRFIESHRMAPFKPRKHDVGVVLDLMIHDLDLIFNLVSAPIKNIHASGVSVMTANEDIANARIEFENGCIANLTVSRVSQEAIRKIRVFQPNAYISMDYQKQEAWLYKKQDEEIIKEQIPNKKEEPLRSELISFIECINEEKEPHVSGYQGKRALATAIEVSEKIKQSYLS